MPQRIAAHALSLPIVATLLVLWVVIPLLAVPASADEPVAASRELLPESPDDPPGEPARALPGALPSSPPRHGRFNPVQVNVAPGGINIPGDAANEPSIAVNPLEPNKMAIGWRQFDTVASNFRQAGRAYTSDGGRTWTFPGVIDPGQFRSDPVLSSDRDGIFYYSSLRGDMNIDVFRSTNHGESWRPPIYAYGGDKQWITIDRTDGIGSGNLYQSWSTAAGCCGTNIFTRSTDGVQTFEYPITLPDLPIWGTLDVAPNGTLHIAGTRSSSPSTFYALRSANAQDPGQTPTFDVATADLGGSITFSAGPNPGGLLGQISMAADPSDGPTAGWVYMLASVDPPGNDPLDIHLVLSWDGGAHWSPWVRVNDDPIGDNNWQWFGTMSVAPNGRIDAIWNDTRDTGTVNLSALYYAFSIDGGITWSPNERVSGWWDSFVGWPNQNKVGDYYHMVSDNVGASLAWAATFNGEQDVYYLRIGDYDCNVNSVPDSVDIATGTSPDINQNGIPDECEDGTSVADGGSPAGGRRLELHANAPNPFNPSTTISYTLVEAGAVRLRVYDSGGRHVQTLVDGEVSAGTRTVTWDGRDAAGQQLPSGVYYCQLEAHGAGETRAMVLLK